MELYTIKYIKSYWPIFFESWQVFTATYSIETPLQLP